MDRRSEGVCGRAAGGRPPGPRTGLPLSRPDGRAGPTAGRSDGRSTARDRGPLLPSAGFTGGRGRGASGPSIRVGHSALVSRSARSVARPIGPVGRYFRQRRITGGPREPREEGLRALDPRRPVGPGQPVRRMVARPIGLAGRYFRRRRFTGDRGDRGREASEPSIRVGHSALVSRAVGRPDRRSARGSLGSSAGRPDGRLVCRPLGPRGVRADGRSGSRAEGRSGSRAVTCGGVSSLGCPSGGWCASRTPRGPCRTRRGAVSRPVPR